MKKKGKLLTQNDWIFLPFPLQPKIISMNNNFNTKKMENNFNEKILLESVKRLGGIVTYFSGNPTAKRFLDIIINHCSFDENDVFSYLIERIMENVPKLKEDIFNLKGWQDFYNQMIKETKISSNFCDLLSYGVNFFNTVKTYEDYFKLTTEVFNIKSENLINPYFLEKIGWLKIVDTLIKLADEDKSEKIETTIAIEEEQLSTTETSGEIDLSKSIEPSIISSIDDKEECNLSISSKKSKRNYDTPVSQYKKTQIFESIEKASESVGVTIEEIKTSIELRPTDKTDAIWTYADKKKIRVVQYTILHTYKNQNDIDKSSKEVCGKKIYHSNVATSLKKWNPIYKGEFVWMQMEHKVSETTILSDYEKTKTKKVYLPMVVEKSMDFSKPLIKIPRGEKSIIPYMGGKSSEMKYILPALPQSFDRYIEPFVGGGSVFTRIDGKEKLVNDFSSEIISLYKYIGESNKEFFNYLRDIEKSWDKAKEWVSCMQEEFMDIYLRFQNNEVSEEYVKLYFHLYCESKRESILGIVKLFGFMVPVLVESIENELYKTVCSLKDNNNTIQKDIYKYLETAVKNSIYLNYRKLYNEARRERLNSPYHIALFCFICLYGFGAKDRFNKKGEYNINFGGSKYLNNKLTSKIKFYQSERLVNIFGETQFFNMDFEDFIRKINPTENDFIFLDPPYDCNFKNYHNHDFGKYDHQRLAHYLINECKAKWMMVISESDFINSLYQDKGLYVYPYNKLYDSRAKMKNKNDKIETHLMITNYPISVDAIPHSNTKLSHSETYVSLSMAA